jgi:CAAX prenyl protease-like protein
MQWFAWSFSDLNGSDRAPRGRPAAYIAGDFRFDLNLVFFWLGGMPSRLQRALDRRPWLAFLGPLAVFVAAGSFEPRPESDPTPAVLDGGDADRPLEGTASGDGRFASTHWAHPRAYSAKLALTLLAMALVATVYFKFPFRFDPRALAFGVAGGAAWIVLCRLEIERRGLALVGLPDSILGGRRSGFNPLVELADSPAGAYAFLAARMLGLIVVVPIIEEFFLRGFVMRWCVDPDRWYEQPLGKTNRAALVAATLVPMAMHPAELIAALVWFSAATWLYARTKSLWNCVVAHGAANAVLAAHAILAEDWRLL